MGCSSRIHGHDLSSSESCLVFDEVSQLSESPGAVAATLSFSNRCLAPNAVQVFEDEHSASVFGFRHQVLGDAMINVSPVSVLSTGEEFEMTFCALGSSFLKFGFQLFTSAHDLVYSFVFVCGSIGIHSEVDDAKIDSESTNRIVWCWFWSINHNREVEYSFSEYEVGLSSNPVHPYFLVVADSNWNLDSPFDGQDGSLFKSFPREDALVVYHCSVGPEPRSFAPVSLVGFAYFGDRSNGHLRGKLEPVSGFAVHKFLEPHLICSSQFVRCGGNEVTCAVEMVHGLTERVELLLGCIQFNQERLLHSRDHTVQYLKKVSPIPPTAEAMGFLGDFSCERCEWERWVVIAALLAGRIFSPDRATRVEKR